MSPLSRWLSIAFPALYAAFAAALSIAEREPLLALVAPPAAVASLALWRRWPGARWYGALGLGALAAERLVRLFISGGAMHALTAVLLAWWALRIFRSWTPLPASPSEGFSAAARSRVPDHLVALLGKHPPADEAWVRQCFERAMPGVESHVHRHREGFFTVQWPGGAMALRVSERGMREELAELAAREKDPRLARAFAEHVDALGVVPLVREDHREMRAIEAPIGRFLAELLAEGCLAIGSNSFDRCVPFHPDLLHVLRSGEPWRVLDAKPRSRGRGDARSAGIDPAAREAQARFPEFASAFAARGSDADAGGFWVKAPFAEGEKVEHLWIRVEALSGETIFGQIESEPLELQDIARGEPVEVERERISDWIFRHGAEAGGFFGRQALFRE